jgi:hypothetical protein
MFSGIHQLVELVEWIVIAGAVVMFLKFVVGGGKKKAVVVPAGGVVVAAAPAKSPFDKFRERVSAPLAAKPAEPIGPNELAKAYGPDELREALWLRQRNDETQKKMSDLHQAAASARDKAMNELLTEALKPSP